MPVKTSAPDVQQLARAVVDSVFDGLLRDVTRLTENTDSDRDNALLEAVCVTTMHDRLLTSAQRIEQEHPAASEAIHDLINEADGYSWDYARYGYQLGVEVGRRIGGAR